MEMAEKINIKLSDDFNDKFTRFTMYFIDMSASNGQMQSYGCLLYTSIYVED